MLYPRPRPPAILRQCAEAARTGAGTGPGTRWPAAVRDTGAMRGLRARSRVCTYAYACPGQSAECARVLATRGRLERACVRVRVIARGGVVVGNGE